MKISAQELINRFRVVGNKASFIGMFGQDINNMLSSVFYYLALEQITDTGQARQMFIRSLNMLHNPLSSKSETEFYNIWGNFPERKQYSGNFQLETYDLGFKFTTDDIGVISQNSSDHSTPRIDTRPSDSQKTTELISIRNSKYKGLLGSSYQKFYIDTIVYYAIGTITGRTPNQLPYVQEYRDKYIKKLQGYLSGK